MEVADSVERGVGERDEEVAFAPAGWAERTGSLLCANHSSEASYSSVAFDTDRGRCRSRRVSL